MVRPTMATPSPLPMLRLALLLALLLPSTSATTAPGISPSRVIAARSTTATATAAFAHADPRRRRRSSSKPSRSFVPMSGATTTTTQRPKRPRPLCASDNVDNNEDDEGDVSKTTGQGEPFAQRLTELTSNFRTAYSEGFGTKAKNVASTMQVGDVVVPLCGDLDKRQRLADRGIYAGVEYTVCELTATKRNQTDGTISAKIRPAYPLRPRLERSDWPVSVDPLADVPLWLSKATYEAGTALGTLGLAAAYLALAAIASTLVRIAFVPTESMMPALNPGDVVLVTRSLLKPRPGDVALFDPPAELDRAIAESMVGREDEFAEAMPTKGKQFLKRIAAVPGESVGVRNSNPIVLRPTTNRDETAGGVDADATTAAATDGPERRRTTYQRIDLVGKYNRPDLFPDSSWNRPPTPLGRGEYFVAGDNGYRSVDSRVWGPLRGKYLFGTARWVVFPPGHFGPIGAGNFAEGVTLNDLPALVDGGEGDGRVLPSIVQPTME